MRYHQITAHERYTLGVLRKQGLTNAAIARVLGRHRSTIGREFKRNGSRHDGAYRYSVAQENTNGRRRRSRRNSQFGPLEWKLVELLLHNKFSPEQISGWLDYSNYSRSVTRPFTPTSGATSDGVDNCGGIYASHSNAANATAATKSGDEWPANATSPSGPPQSRAAGSSAIGRWTPSTAPRPISIASSHSSNVPPAPP